MATYTCNGCGKGLTRHSTKKWITSYCDSTGKNQRLIRSNRNLKLWNHWIADFRDIAIGVFKYPDGEFLSMRQIRTNFGKGMMEYFKDGLTPEEAVYNEATYSD